MPFCSTIAQASSHAPQIGTLGGATVPTETQGGFIWARAYDLIRLRLRRVGVASSFTASSRTWKRA